MEASPSPAEQLAGLAPLPPLPSPEGASIPSLGGQPLAGAAPQESTGTAAPESLESAAEGIPLLPGWNLISLPKEPDSIDPATVFSSIPGALVAAHTYDGCNAADPWRVYAPGAAGVSDLSAVDHRIGVWVQAGGATTLAVSGVEPAETTLQLCEGWNLIGYPSSYPRPVLSALASIAGKFRWVLAYDPADAEDPWEAFDASAPTWANDLQIMRPGRGYWVYATENVSLRLSNTGPPPEVAIVSPADAATITAPTNVTGTVRSDLLESWTLEFRLQGESTFTSFASSNAPVTNAVLGSFDPTLLLNGMYEVRLTARDFAGKTASASINAVVGGQMKIGHFSLSFVDLDVPVAGLPIQVTRTYDSRDKRRGDFGIGWRLSLSDVRLQENRNLGEAWQGIRRPGFIPNFCIVPTQDHIVTITFPSGTVAKFRPRVSPECQPLFPPQFVTISYEPITPTKGGLLPLDHSVNAMVIGSFPGPVELWDEQRGVLHDADRYQFTTPDGRKLVIDQTRGLMSAQDLNGNTLTVSANGISHSSGKGLVFRRDTAGRIEAITDPSGNVFRYAYDEAGDLRSFTDAEANITRYSYNGSHGLLEIFDAKGTRAIRNDYDDSGRVIRHTDAFGRTIELTHRISSRQELITDRLGHSRLLEYDERGNVVREEDRSGNVTLRTFDQQGNLLSETDPLGNRSTYTYDTSGRRTRKLDAQGNETRYTYDSRNNLLTEVNPLGRTTTYHIDARDNVISSTNPAVQFASARYDSRGNPVVVESADGGVSRYEYDRFGNVVREIDPSGAETLSSYDANGRETSRTRRRTTVAGEELLATSFRYDRMGRLVEITNPDGSVGRRAYDPLGKLIEEIDPLGRKTSYTYDPAGRLTTTIYADGTEEKYSYDAEGRRLSFLDRSGRIERYEYDSEGRLVRTTYPDGAQVAQSYDAAGHLIGITDPRGSTTIYEYDALGHRTKEIDALGHETAFSYDAAGNQVSVTDARGNTTRYERDEAGRLIRTVFPDGASTSATYDRSGRVLTETDPRGNTRSRAYDASGRLTTVTDALGQASRFSFDEIGNPLSQTDARGHTTKSEFDGMGRRTKRILPDGSAESFAYDAMGRLVSYTDANGSTIAFDFDANDRPSRRVDPDGNTISFTYAPTGERMTVVDARGTTSLRHDPRGRLIGFTAPDGKRLSYTYDRAGNRTSLTVQVGTTTLVTSYTYDALNRLATVADPQGEIYSYAYDAVGNCTSLRYPNGVVTTYVYDTRNRLTGLQIRGPDGALIESYEYSLDSAGNRMAAREKDGTLREYSYDAGERLTSEVVRKAGNLVASETYEYDAVGNRILLQSSTSTGSSSVTSSYDTRDRLLSEDGADGTTFTWDANGNLQSRQGRTSASFSWDPGNRLREALSGDGTRVSHSYDADGDRISTTVDSSEGSPRTTVFLVDPGGALGVNDPGLLGEVVAEIDGEGAVSAYYLRGRSLLAVLRPSQIRYYHADSQGSIRFLTDRDGQITDRYSYSPFGELVSHAGSDPNPFLFAGGALDSNTDLYQLGARWMEPGTGRFLSPDLLPGSPADPRTLHRYSYAYDNPVNRTDPTGLSPEFWRWFTKDVGDQVHFILGVDFMAKALRPGTRFSNRALSTVLNAVQVGVPVGIVLDDRPDLVDIFLYELFEIKPVQDPFGAIQLDHYIIALMMLDPGHPWHHGWLYIPLRYIDLGAWEVRIYGPDLGLIEYMFYQKKYGSAPVHAFEVALSLIAATALLNIMAIITSMISRPRSPALAWL